MRNNRLFLPVLLASSVLARNSTKKTLCPILGQQYPLPTNLSCSPPFLSATQNLSAAIDARLHDAGFNETTFSLGISSSEEPSDLLWEYHHTDASVSNSAFGVRSADADSIYRVGSVSKLFTVYAFLIRAGEKRLHEPLTVFLSELRGLGVEEGDLDAVLPRWEEITVGEALSQGEYINGVARQQPVFPSSYTPTYSNDGFGIAGAALERFANASFEDVFDEAIVRPLGLKGTSAKTPKSTVNGIIPGNLTSSGWDSDFGAIGPAGGHFSSTRDMAKMSKAILNSDMLPAATTRRWLKPKSFVESFEQGVGMPWEIFRLKVDGYTVDLYTKDGDCTFLTTNSSPVSPRANDPNPTVATYHSEIILIPQFGLGISLLTATATQNGSIAVRQVLSNLLTSTVLPAVAKATKSQAHDTFAGHYTALPHLNSSLTIATDDLPGLKITSWISNGTDFKATFVEKYLGEDIRLMPNLLYDKTGDRVGFTATFSVPKVDADPVADGDPSTWYWKCPSWIAAGAIRWGDVGVEQFVFERGGEGVVEGVVSKGLRVRMKKDE
ncbi:hypothetical protein PRZ48_014387 [Zasmidium cellare]|uniref:Beta-lactamase-related domain-containing protein n=1 Tax=Zasmidium cellare TaxID=395010 RepID=A0ABR0DY57_ZASCE|nr:hypothetical protein PRZ48_014387 [Zasmidium cellare]